MNYLANLKNIFQGESVPMEPQPSIVKAAEDEDIYVNNGAPPGMTQTGSLFGVPAYSPYAAQAEQRREADRISSAPVPMPDLPPVNAPMVVAPPTLTAPTETGPALDVGQSLPDGGIPRGNLPDVITESPIPPQLPEGGVPPIEEEDQGVTWDDMVDGEFPPPVPEGVPPVEEKDQYRDVTHDDIVEGEFPSVTGLPPSTRKIMTALPNEDEIDTPTLEEATEIADNVTAEVPNLYTPPTEEGGSPTPPQVEGPDGKSRQVTKEDVEAVAAKDTGFGKAMNWIQKTFGITGNDLARFALLYVGSRIAGYEHQGSMSWAFEVAGKDFIDRRTVAARLADSGKYTPESIEKYKNTGDASKLKAVQGDKGGIKFDYTKGVYKSGTNELVYPATLANGTKAYVDPKTGKTYLGEVEDISKAGSVQKTRPDRVKRNSTIMTEHMENMDDENPWWVGSVTEDAEVVQDRIDWWADNHDVSLDDGVTARVVGNAARQAKRWAAATGGTVDTLAHFIDAQLIYMSNKNPWAQQLHKNGEQLDPKDIASLTDNILKFAMTAPGDFDPTKVERGMMLNTFMEYAYEEYRALTPEQRKRFEKDGDGFYTYLITQFGTTKEK